MPDRKDVSRRIDGTSFASIMLLKDYPFDDDNDIVDQFIDNFCQVMVIVVNLYTLLNSFQLSTFEG